MEIRIDQGYFSVFALFALYSWLTLGTEISMVIKHRKLPVGSFTVSQREPRHDTQGTSLTKLDESPFIRVGCCTALLPYRFDLTAIAT